MHLYKFIVKSNCVCVLDQVCKESRISYDTNTCLTVSIIVVVNGHATKHFEVVREMNL